MWPSTKITRVEATLSAKRSMVANSKIAGKDENSKGLRVLMAIMMTTKDTTILKVNSKSSSSGGSGSTIIAMMSSTKPGMAKPAGSNRLMFCRRIDRLLLIMVFVSGWPGVLPGFGSFMQYPCHTTRQYPAKRQRLAGHASCLMG